LGALGLLAVSSLWKKHQLNKDHQAEQQAEQQDLQEKYLQVVQERDELQKRHQSLEDAFSEATQDLKESLAKQYSIMDHMLDGILITDFSGKTLQNNASWTKLFHQPWDTELEGSFDELYPDELVNLWHKTSESVGTLFSCEFQLPGNRIGQATMTAMNHMDESDGFFVQNWFGVLCLVRDITQEREIDRMKNDFISTVSHELRTPLTSILGFAKVIQKKLNNNIIPNTEQSHPKTQRAIKRITKNLHIIWQEGERLTGLINDILDIAKMEAGKMEFREGPISLHPLIEQASNSVHSLLEPKGLHLAFDFAPEIPELKGDNDRLIQVMVNLLSNAVKFTDEGTITCRTRYRDEHVEVCVEDMGIGIAPEDLDKVFDRFQQVGDVFTDKPKGTGLGLPICQQIIQYHGGKMWVESEQGQGSSFFFTLPLTSEQDSPPKQ